jgi:hypothetical protein
VKSLKNWIQKMKAHLQWLQANGPIIGHVEKPGGANPFFGTINGRVVTSMGLPTAEYAEIIAREIHAKNQKPGLPDLYLSPAFLMGVEV